MRVVKTVDEMQQASRECRMTGRKIAFVPTMGALHEGHLSLVETAKERGCCCGVYLCQPTQFAPNEDFESYPRDTERDLGILQEMGVDFVFTPTAESMYPDDHTFFVDERRSLRPFAVSHDPATSAELLQFALSFSTLCYLTF